MIRPTFPAVLAVSALALSLGAQTIQTITTNGLHEPHSVAVNPANNAYYLTDSMNGRILKYASGEGLSVLTDTGLAVPEGLVFARNGLVVADWMNHQIWFSDLDGNLGPLLAGSTAGLADGTGAAAKFNYPIGLATDGAGNIYIADSKNSAVRKLDALNAVTTVTNLFYEPEAVALDGAGRLFIADTRNHVIKLVTNGVVAIVAGRVGFSGSQDATSGTNATFQFPRALLWVGGQTGLLVSDSGNNTIRRLVFNSAMTRCSVDTFAGAAGQAGLVDGAFATARFNAPRGMARDVEGAIVLADLKNNALRRILLPVQPVPVVIPGGGAYSNSVSLLVTSTVPNVVLRYTTSGAAVDANSPVTSGPMTFTQGPVPLQVRGYSTEYLVSSTVSNYYTFFVNPLQITVPGGTFNNSVSVTITTLTANAEIRYTTDGTTPTASSTVWNNGAYEINGPLQVGAFRTGFSPSPILSNYFNFVVATPTVIPAGTTATNGVEVTLSCGTTNAQLRWTIDGNEVTSTSTLYTGPFILTNNGTLRVKGFKSGYVDSSTVSSVFNLFVATPTVVPNGATANNDVAVKLNTDTVGAALYWTIDGTDPSSTNTSSALYTTNGITLGTNGTLKVKGFRSGFLDSQITGAIFNLSVGAPVVTPASATATNGVVITMTTTATNAQLRWTIDGTEPTSASPLYTTNNAFTLATNGTLRVKGFKSGYVESPTVSGVFNLFVATPEILPNGATTNNDVEVTLKCATTSAQLYWTINGTDPTPSNGVRYTVPFMLGTNGTLKVRGFQSGFVDSQIASAVFNIGCGLPDVKPTGGTSTNAVVVTMTNATIGAGLYWTIDGSEPTINSALYDPINKLTLGTNGLLKVKAIKSGYVDSPTVSNLFNLFVATPVISPNGATSNNDVPVTITCDTTNTSLYWTINGTDPAPTNGALYTGAITLGTNGTLKVKGFRSGFVDSAVASAVFNISVAPPVVTPPGATASNDVTVLITNATTGATLYYTTDGSEPATTNAVYTGAITLQTNGTLKVKGFKSGYVDSPTVSSVFNLIVDTPAVTSDTGTNINSVTATATTGTTSAQLRYTTDGSTPTTSSTLYGGALTFTTNAVLNVIGFRTGYTPSAMVTRQYKVQVDKPTMSPSGGFFPDGAMITFTVVRADAKIYYTLNGQDPTVNDNLYTGPFSFSQVSSLGLDLSAVKARAFATNALPSDIVAGQATSTNVNTVGMARDAKAGIGATVLVPISVSLQNNVVLKSVQFVAQVSPVGAAPAMTTNDLWLISITTNDFARVTTPSLVGSIPYATWDYAVYASGTTNNIVVISRPTPGGATYEWSATGNKVLVVAAVKIPTGAVEGDTYQVSIMHPSGTSDGQQTSVPLVPMAARTITVTNITYVVGDSSPGTWYNAGDFGNGDLDNSDVNNAAYASAGYRVPPSYTDAFNAMDAFPPDSGAVAGGDGEIRLLDWQMILLRSLRLDTNNYYRKWSVGGAHVAQTTVLPSAVRAKSATMGAGPGLVWARQAKVYASGLTNVTPGSVCSIPVYVDVASGCSVAGLQFLAMVLPQDGAAMPTAVTFVSSVATPFRNDSVGNTVFCAWNTFGSSMLSPSLQGSNNLVGNLRVAIPQTSRAGDHYIVRFVGADGAAAIPLPYNPLQLPAQYNVESVPASIWVLAAAALPPEIISDEWKTNFFGSVESTNAAFNLDFDGDGMPNWQEYLAGTDPTKLGSCLKVLQTHWTNGVARGVLVRWLSAPGKSYKVDRSASLTKPSWTPVASGVPGTGNTLSITDTNPPGQTFFYRVRLEP